jgi:MFS family permease
MDAHAVAPSAGMLRAVLVPLALAQFICSFAGSNMNVMINDISKDLDTTVQGVQVAITLFLLVMAALMIPAGRLTGGGTTARGPDHLSHQLAPPSASRRSSSSSSSCSVAASPTLCRRTPAAPSTPVAPCCRRPG